MAVVVTEVVAVLDPVLVGVVAVCGVNVAVVDPVLVADVVSEVVAVDDSDVVAVLL